MYKVEYKIINSYDGGSAVEHVKKITASLSSLETVLKNPNLEFITIRRVNSKVTDQESAG